MRENKVLMLVLAKQSLVILWHTVDEPDIKTFHLGILKDKNYGINYDSSKTEPYEWVVNGFKKLSYLKSWS